MIEAPQQSRGAQIGVAPVSRPQRLDSVVGANEQNIEHAARILESLKSIRNRLSGGVPDAPNKETARAKRSGHVGALEDHADTLDEILKQTDEVVDQLRGL